MPAQTRSYTVQYNPSGAWLTLPAADLLDVGGDLELSGDASQPLMLGDAATARATLTIRASAWGSFPARCPIRVDLTRDSTTQRVFTGLVVERARSLLGAAATLGCASVERLISTTRADSPAFFRRPVATRTTLTSIDDPTNGGYAGGLINYLLWQAGGRPAEQDASYPSATFYYSCEPAILAPEWSWAAGEDAWEELRKLASAAGGQIFIDAGGIVRYRQPLAFGGGSATYTFTESVYGDIAERIDDDTVLATRIQCPYVPRVARPLQEVISDDTPRLIAGSSSVTFDLAPQWPLKSLEHTSGVLADDALTILFLDGQIAPRGAGGYDHTITVYAQRITIAIENNTTRPMIVRRVLLRGEPITAGEPGMVEAGSGSVTRTLADNPYVQSRGHAQRLSNLHLALYATPRARRTLSGCAFDPGRTLGETVNLTCAAWSLSAVPHLITAIRHSRVGAEVSYDLVDVSGLPGTNEYYLVGATNYTGLTRRMGF